MREFKGETLVAAISATFTRRATPLPEGAPLALTAAFSEDPAKQALWQAFLRKGRLDAEGKSLTEVVGGIRDFLLPPVDALNVGKEFRRVWKDRQWSEIS